MEQGFRSDSTVMPDRQDTRPPVEADARRDAAAAALLSAPRTPASGPSPALVAMVAEWQDLLAQINDESVTDDQAEPLGQRHNELQLAICCFPAASVADLLVKVPVFEDEMRDAVGGLTEGIEPKDTLSGAAWLGLFRDFERLARARTVPAAAETTLAHMIVDYFGSDPIDPQLTSDLALREKAAAILAAATPDPVFAVIAESQRLFDAWTEANKLPLDGLNPGPEAQAASRAFHAHCDDVLLQTVPQTAAGCAALARYAHDFAVREGWTVDQSDEDSTDHLRILDLIARSPLLTEPSPSAASPLISEASPAADLASACVEQVARLDRWDADPEAMSEEEGDTEMERWGALCRRATNEPAVTLRDLAGKAVLVHADLDRFYPLEDYNDSGWQMMRALVRDAIALGSVALPTSAHPAGAETALSRAIRAHQAAYDVFAAACPAIDPVAVRQAGGDDSEEAMAPAWETWHATNDIAFQAWRDLFRHRPESLNDLLLLLRHIQQHHAGHVGIEDEPDVFGYLVESVAGLLPVAAQPARDTAGPDPIFDALKACLAPEAEMEAFHALHSRGKTGPGYSAEREMALYSTAADAWNAVFATMPTTQGGRAALLAFIERRIEEESSPGGPAPDGEGTVFDRAYRALARVVLAERIEIGFDLSKLTMLQLSNYHDAFEASAVNWLYISNAGWAEDTAGIAEAEYDRHARMRSAVAGEIKLRTPADDWDGDVRLAALIRDEMLCNGSLRHAPALRAAIAQRWGAAA